MPKRIPVRAANAILALAVCTASTAATVCDVRAQTATPSSMQWRMIGPHRGGRTKAGTGVPSQPNVFYVGFVNGGVWKTDDYGRVWTPVFDDEGTGSIGAIAVSESNPDIVYAGSGEGIQRPDLTTGDGIYRSNDAGRTWTHLGLRDAQQIPQIIIDPKNPDRIFVAVLGHPYGPNEERGVFRSTDGGRTFEKVLYRDENTGSAEVAFDPSNANTIYAVMWEARQAPWENGAFSGPGSGLYKSTDGGTTWRQIGAGLPTGAEGLGRVGIGVSASNPSRLYAVVSAPEPRTGIYRSDDAGENWVRVNDDARLAGRDGDFDEIKVDPANADVAYVANVMSWKTTDGGRTFKEFRGAPGGDDYQRFWINPRDPNIILITADQGAIVTVNGGRTFSSWYNQPTAQLYHVNADYNFPYRVCGGQQESGSVCISSRSDDGQITFHDWHPAGVEEYGYVVPDPLHHDIYFGGRVTRTDWRTGDVQNVSPTPAGGPFSRMLRTAPVIFSTVDPHILYFGTNVVWKTTTGGQSWTRISPDLTRTDSVVPSNVGTYGTTRAAMARHPGVVYTIAPSHLNTRWIWAGTDDGLIQRTRDGGATWKDVTPAALRARPWSKISIIDAGHFDSLTAYVAVNTFRLDDLTPHLYATHDGGMSWKEIDRGIPAGGVTNVIREDPVRKGLLFAGTEQAAYYSIDDGESWRSLRLNMPATAIRDLIIKDNDIVVATHGRSFWILDDIAPLRQIASADSSSTKLFKPSAAYRVRWNRWPDTPLPPDEPAGQNGPDGAVIDYRLRSAADGPVVIEILNSAGAVVRRLSSADPIEQPLTGTNVPSYWPRPQQRVATDAGLHRFVWDLHYAYPSNVDFGYPISATPHDTEKEPHGPWVMPGTYTVRLTADGRRYTQPLVVRMDPRVKTPVAGLQQQFDLSMSIYNAINSSPASARSLLSLYRALQDTDAAPTTQVVAAVKRALTSKR
jgi:photosystem II stability/assembly factor-like uncharacterized protein